MAKFQLIGCEINIGGDRDNTVVKDQFDPITYPEYIVLQALHGGADHVHSAVVVGEIETDAAVERERLEMKYGAGLIGTLFPGAMAALPFGDKALPSSDELEAGKQAAKKAQKAAREAKVETTIEAPKKPVLPDLTQ